MILVRLKRQSFDNKLSYSIIITSDKLSPQSGNFIEKIGYYKPLMDKWSNKYIFIDLNRLFFWLKRGAKMNINLYVILRPLILNFLKNINLKGK